MNPETSANILEVSNLNKSFHTVQALKNVDIYLKHGEILGLVGENGAGKSTLLKIIAGVHSSDSGNMELKGSKYSPSGVFQASQEGVAMMFQEQSLLSNLSLGKNIFLGHEEHFIERGFIRWDKLYEAASNYLHEVGLKLSPKVLAKDLSFRDRQMVELAKALAVKDFAESEPIILMDEPTSVLEREEVENLFKKMDQLRKKEGVSFIFVSHRLDEVLEVSDRVYVLKDGRKVAERDISEVREAELHELMVGKELKDQYYKVEEQVSLKDKVVLQIDQLTKADKYTNCTFDLRKGEIIGLAGVLGSGREELQRSIAGIIEPDDGTIFFNERKVHIHSPAKAHELGIGYIPQERTLEGIIPYLNVEYNLTASALDKVSSRGIISSKKESNLAEDWVERLDIKTPSLDTLTSDLSGGNQQKVILAKWLASEVEVLILDHPTRGLDVGAKEDIYEFVRELTKKGLSIILTSDTLEELIALSNTIYTMKDGLITNSYEAPKENKPSQESIINGII